MYYVRSIRFRRDLDRSATHLRRSDDLAVRIPDDVQQLADDCLITVVG